MPRFRDYLAAIGVAVATHFLEKGLGHLCGKLEQKALEWHNSRDNGSGIGAIVLQPISNQLKTRDEWTALCPQGVVLAALSDYYHAAKYSSPFAIDNLRMNMENYPIVTSTVQHCNDLEAVVTEYAGLAQQWTTTKTRMPKCKYMPLNQVIREESGLSYLQSIFNTKDDADTITKNLSSLCGKKAEDILLSTGGPGIYGVSLWYIRENGKTKFAILADSENESGMAFAVMGKR